MDVQLPQQTLLAIIAVQQEIVETDVALHEVMGVVARAAARLTGSDAAVVELQEGAEMVYRAVAGTAANFIGLRLRATHSLSGLCVQLDRTLRCDDRETDDRVDREACRRVGARSRSRFSTSTVSNRSTTNTATPSATASCVAEPIADGSATLHVSATAGVAVFPADAASTHALLDVADARMYAEKHEGR